MKQRWFPVLCALVVASGLLITGCSKEKDDDEGTSALVTAPSSSSSSSSSSGSSSSGSSGSSPATAVAFTQDIKAVLAAGCTRCHGEMATYTGTMTHVTAGSASSRLVTKTQSSGSMYRYLPADAATNAALIRTWVVNGAPENR